MSTFTLAISCLTSSNLPWFMDLTFQVPMQYCSLPHRTLLLSPITSTTGYCFCFGSISSFFLELFLHWYSSFYFNVLISFFIIFIYFFIFFLIFLILKSLILTCIPKHEPPSHLPPHNISLGHPHAPAPSMLYPMSDIDWRFDSYMIVYMLQFHSPKSSHPLPLPQSPKVCY